jgi:ribose-phosphate pyrophosphokinase
MKVYTKAGYLPHELMTFPDGQRHVKLQMVDSDGYRHATIETCIANATELFDVLLVKDVLQHQGYTVNLDIRYLLGARMDRRIDAFQPFTLAVVAQLLNGAGFHRIRILDPHSSVSTSLLNAEAVYPVRALFQVLRHYNHDEDVVVAPDAGAIPRVDKLLRLTKVDMRAIQGFKKRDPETGQLSGFGVNNPEVVRGKHCLILDDICDGGGTFVGLAEELRKAGATQIDLFVTHGLFTKPTPLTGIDSIYTTDSYRDADVQSGVTWLHVNMEKLNFD